MNDKVVRYRLTSGCPQPACSLLVLVLAVGLVFWPVLGFDFLTLDDGVNVYANRYLQKLNWENLLRFWQGPYENLYIPLTYTAWALLAGLSSLLEGAAGGVLDPRLFHAANLLAHLGASFTVFLILRELLGADERAPLVGALVFALHPLQVEAVAWVTAFRDLFSAFWALLALWCHLRYLRQGGWIQGNRRFHLLATTLFLFALLAKPGAVVLPLVTGLFAGLGLRRPWRLTVLEMAPWVGLAAPVVIFTTLSQPGLPQDFAPGWGGKVLVAGDAISFYLGKLLLPVGLCADYGRSPQFLLSHGWSWVSGLLPLLAGFFLLWKGERFWRLAAGLFVVALLPVLGLVAFDFQRVSTVADRYLYLAMLAPALAAGYWFNRSRRRLTLAVAVVALGLLGTLSLAQLRHWRDSSACYRRTLNVNPASWYASNNLGTLYLEQGDLASAEALFRKAVELRADFAEAHNNLGYTLAAGGRLREAFAAYRTAIRLAPGYPEPYGNLAALYRREGMRQEAIDFFGEAVRRDPSRAAFHDGLGSAYLEAGQGEAASQAFARAIEVDPGYAPAYEHLVSLLLAAGKAGEAARYRELAARHGLDALSLSTGTGRLP